LRTQDEVPDWVTHVALVQDGTVKTGTKNSILPLIKRDSADACATLTSIETLSPGGQPVLDLQNVSVKYGDRVVSVWQILFFFFLIVSVIGSRRHQLENKTGRTVASPRHEWCAFSLLH